MRQAHQGGSVWQRKAEGLRASAQRREGWLVVLVDQEVLHDTYVPPDRGQLCFHWELFDWVRGPCAAGKRPLSRREGVGGEEVGHPVGASAVGGACAAVRGGTSLNLERRP